VRCAKRVPPDEGLLRKRIRVLAAKYIRYGYRRIANELRKEGRQVRLEIEYTRFYRENYKEIVRRVKEKL